jgi:hypothetical protein
MAKYEPLSRHLRTATRPVSMTFDEISQLVGGLPPSAYRHREWWANNPRMHVSGACLARARASGRGG